jgi:hypothetical protein
MQSHALVVVGIIAVPTQTRWGADTGERGPGWTVERHS